MTSNTGDYTLFNNKWMPRWILSAIGGKWSNLIMSNPKCSDCKGRWSSLTMIVNGKSLLIITAYWIKEIGEHGVCIVKAQLDKLDK